MIYKIIDNEKNVVVAVGSSMEDMLESWERIIRIEQVRLQSRYTLQCVGVDQKQKTMGLMSEAAPDSMRLKDDDFEAIRIHLNAYKEKLCNEGRWKEAEEYQRIIYRFVKFASAHAE